MAWRGKKVDRDREEAKFRGYGSVLYWVPELYHGEFSNRKDI